MNEKENQGDVWGVILSWRDSWEDSRIVFMGSSTDCEAFLYRKLISDEFTRNVCRLNGFRNDAYTAETLVEDRWEKSTTNFCSGACLNNWRFYNELLLS